MFKTYEIITKEKNEIKKKNKKKRLRKIFL